MMIDDIYISIRNNRYYDFDKAKRLLYFSQKTSIYSLETIHVLFFRFYLSAVDQSARVW